MIVRSAVVMADYQLPSRLSPEACDLIRGLLRKNPAERLPLEDILSHPFMKKRLQRSQRDETIDSGLYTMSTLPSLMTPAVSSTASTASAGPLAPVAAAAAQVVGRMQTAPLWNRLRRCNSGKDASGASGPVMAFPAIAPVPTPALMHSYVLYFFKKFMCLLICI